MALASETRQKIRAIFEKFLSNRIKTIRGLKLEDLDINPFVVRLFSKELGLNDSKSIVTWLLNQRLERGTVTSGGTWLQKIAGIFCEPTGVEGADLMKRKGAHHHYLQVKSGPNTVDKDACRGITRDLRSAQRRHPGSITVFGMAYGNPDRVSDIVNNYLDCDKKLIGKEFWEFVSDDPNCMLEIYEIAGEVGGQFRDKRGQTLAQVMNQKTQQLIAEFEAIYGKSGDEMWENLFKRNS